MAIYYNLSKNTTTVYNRQKTGYVGMTWDEATMTWNEATFTWNQGGTQVYYNRSKNTTTVYNRTKS